MAAGAASCCCSIPSAQSGWEERQHWAGRPRSSRAQRFCVVARMSGGRGGRSYGGGGRTSFGRGGGRGRGRGRMEERNDDDSVLMNEGIRAPFLRLIADDQQIGIVSRDVAFQQAAAAELDLVIVAPDADPPVAKIMDYSKFKYEQQKKKRDQQKKAAATKVELKELKMRYNIDTHDYQLRLKQAKKFLKDGDKVKVFMPFRGREHQFKDLGLKLLEQFEGDLGELAVTESKTVGDAIYMTLAPSKSAKADKDRLSKGEAATVAS